MAFGVSLGFREAKVTAEYMCFTSNEMTRQIRVLSRLSLCLFRQKMFFVKYSSYFFKVKVHIHPLIINIVYSLKESNLGALKKINK